MKKTIKTADLIAYLDNEIHTCEVAAEKYCVQLDLIEHGDREPDSKVRERLTKNWGLMENNIGTLSRVKQHIVYHLARKEY